MRAAFDRLRTERIRAESEVERLERELERVRAAARATFDTDDEGEIAQMIEAARAQNTRLMDEFESRLHDIETRLAKLGGGA
jgi:hypothetical protein